MIVTFIAGTNSCVLASLEQSFAFSFPGKRKFLLVAAGWTPGLVSYMYFVRLCVLKALDVKLKVYLISLIDCVLVEAFTELHSVAFRNTPILFLPLNRAF